MKKVVFSLIPAVIGFSIMSCQKQNVNPQNSSTGTSKVGETQTLARLADNNNYTAEDYFVGIFFLKGNVANEVTSLVNLKSQLNNGELNTLSNRATNVLNVINAQKPDFIQNFGTQLLNKDPKSVQAALDYAVQVMTDLGISNGESQHVVQELEAGKNCHKWVVINHFLIKRKLDNLSLNTGNINAPEVLLEKEILVSDIVSSFQP